MSWVISAPVPYHQQDQSDYCGAAAGQMLLDKLGVGLLGQDTLFGLGIEYHLDNWWTTPAQMANLLNLNRGSNAGTFVVDAQTDGASSMARIIGHLIQLGTAVPVVVQSGQHWVLVCGIETDSQPSAEGQVSILSLWINDPWPTLPASAPPPPHTDPDSCGSQDGGQANQHLVWSEWVANYFNACSLTGTSPPQYFSVVDSRATPIGSVSL
jgi:hypothetical protein